MKISNIIRHIRHYEKTGRISNALVPYFNQHGKWCEELITPLPDKGPRARYEIPHSLMQKITLPKERRFSGDMESPVLRTSFVTRNDKMVAIPYAEIRGSFLAKGKASIDAELLEYVGGDFSTDTSRTVYIPSLHTVGGNFAVTRSFKLTATSLHDVRGSVYLVGSLPPNLVTIGGRCIIQRAICTSCNILRHVGKALIFNDLDKVQFPKLESVGEDMIMHSANRIEARMLREVRGTLLAGQAKMMFMPKLRFVGGDLNSQLAREFYHPQLEVRGRWMQARGVSELWIRRKHALDVLKGNQGPLYL
jgi:hypothetical protein